jgi:hypothetical protein
MSRKLTLDVHLALIIRIIARSRARTRSRMVNRYTTGRAESRYPCKKYQYAGGHAAEPVSRSNSLLERELGRFRPGSGLLQDSGSQSPSSTVPVVIWSQIELLGFVGVFNMGEVFPPLWGRPPGCQGVSDRERHASRPRSPRSRPRSRLDHSPRPSRTRPAPRSRSPSRSAPGDVPRSAPG